MLILDGSQFDDLPGLAREFSKHLDAHEWHGGLDAFDDILAGGFGTPEGGFVLRWLNSERSAHVLGAATFLTLLTSSVLTDPVGTRAKVASTWSLSSARRGKGVMRWCPGTPAGVGGRSGLKIQRGLR